MKFLRDPDPGILHIKCDDVIFISVPDLNRTLVGKFHGIADQVIEYLVKPFLIGYDDTIFTVDVNPYPEILFVRQKF